MAPRVLVLPALNEWCLGVGMVVQPWLGAYCAFGFLGQDITNQHREGRIATPSPHHQHNTNFAAAVGDVNMHGQMLTHQCARPDVLLSGAVLLAVIRSPRNHPKGSSHCAHGRRGYT